MSLSKLLEKRNLCPQTKCDCFDQKWRGKLYRLVVIFLVVWVIHRLLTFKNMQMIMTEPARTPAPPCRIDIVVISDRIDNRLPLQGLINSILLFTSRPVTMHIVTTARTIPWLQKLHSQHFQIYLYHPLEHGLYNRSLQLMSRTSFRSTHYSAKFALQKLYLPLLPYPNRPPKVLMLDDDIIFYNDLLPLWNILYKTPNSLSLYCPMDSFYAKLYFADRNATYNGDSIRYCISGMMRFPIVPQSNQTNHSVVDLFESSTANMMREYPNIQYSVADQDVINRVYADFKYGRNKSRIVIDLIPWEWGCNYGRCKDPSQAGNKETCPDRENYNATSHTCYSFHFLTHKYQEHVSFQNPELEYDTMFQRDPQDLLRRVFNPKIDSIGECH